MMFDCLKICTILSTCYVTVATYECDKDASVCKTSLIIEHKLSMMHPRHRSVFTFGGNLYKHDVTNTSVAKPVPTDEVIVTDGWETPKMCTVANGTFPGPPIIVYEGQRLIIHVKNDLYSDTTSLHWHGLPQVGSPWMDGVPFITQCPILPGQTFTYDFIAKPKGTYFYHAHVGFQRSKGLFGALIVKEKQDIMKDIILNVQGWNHKWDSELDFLTLLTGVYENRRLLPWSQSFYGELFTGMRLTSALINGKGRYYNGKTSHNGTPLTIFSVSPGEEYRLRIIGASAYYAMRVSVDSHMIKVVASDGYDLEPIEAESVIVNPGERYDAVIYTNKSVGNYWIRATTLEKENPHTAQAILRYEGASETEPVTNRRVCSSSNPCVTINCPYHYFPADTFIECVNFDKLKSANSHDPAPRASAQNLKEYFLNFAFVGGSSINGRGFIHPEVSALTQSHEVDNPCELANCGEHKTCRCTHSLTLNHNEVVQLVLTNMGRATGQTHPIHIHGFSFYVLKIGFANDNVTSARYISQNTDIDCRGIGNQDESFCNDATWRNSSWLGGNVPGLELDQPPRKDTLLIPTGGYAVIRLKADNPGLWSVHCHLEQHNAEGMFMLLNVSYPMHPKPPKGFPTCHSFPRSLSQEVMTTTPKPHPTNQVTLKRNIEDEPYTMKMYWVTVAVMALVILLMIAYIFTLRDKLKNSEKTQEHKDKDRDENRF